MKTRWGVYNRGNHTITLNSRLIEFDIEKIDYVITHTEQAVKGNTSSGAQKDATLENGMIVKVPLFINEGESIIISTSDGKYVSRSK